MEVREEHGRRTGSRPTRRRASVQKTRGGFRTQKEAERDIASVIVAVSDGTFIERPGNRSASTCSTSGCPRLRTRSDRERMRPTARSPVVDVAKRDIGTYRSGRDRRTLQRAERRARARRLVDQHASLSPHSMLHRALRDAVRRGLTPTLPTWLILPGEHKPACRSRTAGELRRFLTHVENDRLMRSGEPARRPERAAESFSDYPTSRSTLTTGGYGSTGSPRRTSTFGPPKSRRRSAPSRSTSTPSRRYVVTSMLSSLSGVLAGRGLRGSRSAFRDELGRPLATRQHLGAVHDRSQGGLGSRSAALMFCGTRWRRWR